MLLAAGLLLFGLLFRQLVTLLLAILVTVVVAIPLAAAAQRLERYRIPRPVGALADPARRHRRVRPAHLPADPAVRGPDERVRGRRALDRPRPREGLRRRDRPERRRGRRQGPALLRALHRRARPPDRPAHLDRAERRRRPGRPRADPHHGLLHGHPARAAGGGARATGAAAAPRPRTPGPRPHPGLLDRLDGGRRDRHDRHGRDALRGAHDRGSRLRDLLRRALRAARRGALLRRHRRRDPAHAVRAHRLARQGGCSCSAPTSSCSSSRATSRSR